MRSSTAGLEDVGAGVDEVGRRLVARRLLDEGLHPARLVGRDHPEGARVLHRGQADRRLGSPVAVEARPASLRSWSVRTSPLTTTKVSSMPAWAGGEPDGPGGVERGRLDRVGHPDTGDGPVGIGVDEGVGPVAEREHGVVDPVGGQVAEHPLDHRLLDDRQHLLGRGEGQRPQAGALAAHQDDGPHLLLPPGGAWSRWRGSGGRRSWSTVVAGVVVAGEAVVRGRRGGRAGWSTAVIRLVMAWAGGLGTVAVAGTKAMVISWPLANWRSWGGPLVSVRRPWR